MLFCVVLGSRQRKERLYHIDDTPSGVAEVIQDLDRSYEVSTVSILGPCLLNPQNVLICMHCHHHHHSYFKMIWIMSLDISFGS
jgi:hypothetical protein